MCGGEDQSAEVAVFGQEYSGLVSRELDDVFVAGAR